MVDHCILKGSFCTKNYVSVPEPPRLFRGSYEVMASVSGGSRSLRLHWAVYPAENIHGDNLTFLVRVGSMTQETRHHFIDLVNLTHPGVLSVFAKNEVGMSEESGIMILPELQYPDILPKPLEAAILDTGDNGSRIVWRMPGLTEKMILESGVEDVLLPRDECEGPLESRGCGETSVTLAWCHHARTRACEDGLKWRTLAVGDPRGGLWNFHVPDPVHPDYAFLSVVLNGTSSGLEIIRSRVSVPGPHTSSLEPLQTNLTSITLRLNIESIDQLDLLLDKWSLSWSQRSYEESSLLTSNRTSITVSGLSPASCYLFKHKTSLRWNISVEERREQLFCTSPVSPANISAAQLLSGTIVVTIGRLPYTEADRGHLNLTCHISLDTVLVSVSPCSEVLVVSRALRSRGHCHEVRLRVSSTAGGQSAWSASVRLVSPPRPPTLSRVTTTSEAAMDSVRLALDVTGEDADYCEVSSEDEDTGEAGLTSCPGVQCRGQSSGGCCSLSRNEATLDLSLPRPASCTKYNLMVRCSNYFSIDDVSSKCV